MTMITTTTIPMINPVEEPPPSSLLDAAVLSLPLLLPVEPETGLISVYDGSLWV